MVGKKDLDDWVYAALKDHEGRAKIARVSQHIWEAHEEDLRASGDLFYTWQYDMRWAAQRLAKAGKLNKTSEKGFWHLVR